MSDIDLYIKWLTKFKIESKISYSKLGEVINYSDVGISKAIKKNTLSINHVVAIAEKFNQSEKLNEFININKLSSSDSMTCQLNTISDDELSLIILQNKKRFLNNDVIRMWIENMAIQKAKKLIKEEIIEELNVIKEQLNKIKN